MILIRNLTAYIFLLLQPCLPWLAAMESHCHPSIDLGQDDEFVVWWAVAAQILGS